ncbi:MAG: CHAD domain-containing protein [Candidatus Acidiferrum sp.]
MATGSTVTGSRPEIRGLSYWMERVLKELDSVRKAPEPDAVHDLRVAIRRCRSVAGVMEEVDPDAAWPAMRKLGKKLFRQLGELRDTQVLEEWTEKLGPEADSIRERLLTRFATAEKELQQAAVKAVDKFDHKSWKKLERKLQRRSHLVVLDGLAAECLALERLEAAKELHVRALRAEKPEAWHALRVGVKRFRYTVESLLPARYEQWGEDLKGLQDLLGEVHDLDVLSTKIAEVAGELDEQRAAWAERIASQRHQRIEEYRRLTIGESGHWQHWRQGLPEGSRLITASQARLRATARALEADTRRAMLVSRLAARLFDALAKLHTVPALADKNVRKILRGAARLHGIGTGLDVKSPEKAARKYLKAMVLPPGWTEPEWDIMVNVIRYQRGGLPDPQHKSFARFRPEEQKLISTLAGVLRLARALGKSGVSSPTGLRAENSVEALIVRVPGLQESEENAARLAAGKYLLEINLGKPLIVKAAQLAPRLVELPRKEELPAPSSAVASD